MSIPKHIAIIMDGNGRWASIRNKQRTFGHIKGSRQARKIVEECRKKGIQNLTLFAFSMENWKRPDNEVAFLMRILTRYLKKEHKTLIKQNIRFRTIGSNSLLPKELSKVILETEEATKKNTGMNLNLALSYGGRQEILLAVKSLCEEVKRGDLQVDQISEEHFEKHLLTYDLPDPDLIIRTSGELRISNFLLWQSAYSEFYITQTLWPEFGLKDLNLALESYGQRERRYGLTSSQIPAATPVKGPLHEQHPC